MRPSGLKSVTPIRWQGGYVARSIISCDGGVSWLHDQSDDNTVRCFVSGDPNDVNCDQTGNVNHSLDYDGVGYFYGSYGWGWNGGTIRRSPDGVNWTTIYSNPAAGLGIFAFGEKLALLWNYWSTSTDGGLTWAGVAVSPATQLFDPAIYKFGSTILTTGGEAASGSAISTDQGVTWQVSLSVPTASVIRGVVYGQNMYVGFGVTPSTTNLSIATSTDGLNWTTTPSVNSVINASVSSNPVFDGEKFMIWGNGVRVASSDGVTWSQDPVTCSDSSFNIHSLQGVTTFDPATHHYLMMTGSYASQKAFWSADGLAWTEVTSDHFTGGHPMRNFTIGEADSSVCTM